MNRHHYGLILAGGRGTRFWPRSRKRSAKQVLNVVGERSLIQATVDRLAPVIRAGAPLGADQRSSARHHHQAAARDSRSTRFWPSPCSATPRPPSAWRRRFCTRMDPDAVMGVFPSDHVIGKTAAVPRRAEGGASRARPAAI